MVSVGFASAEEARASVTAREATVRGRTAVLVAAALYALPASAQAAQGDVLRVLRPDRTGTACAVRGSSGIAFDGRRLWLSCPGDQTLIAVSTRDGRQLVRRDAAPFPVRALTWDSARQRLLGCAGGTVVGIDPAAPGSQVPQVVGGGGPRSCVALAYDAPTDALWRLTYRGLVQVVRLSGPGADGAQPRAVAPRCGLDGLALGRGDAALL